MVEVRDRERDGVAEHQPQRDVLGHLVQGAGRVELPGAKALDDQGHVQSAGDRVCVGVADVDRHRLATVVAQYRATAVRRGLEGLVPAHLDQFAVPPHHRGAEPVRVAVEGSEAGALGADEAGAEDVFPIAAGLGHPALLDGE